ncbi:hypothetical protein NDU88_006361 [Pleurodeles waltl]|uniref:Uncharacterized protein n=1 Tax=Pleurodeles waltl TaxID=8319 RepID=A0AAV7TE59_PLEWA|nr:hypothetical protein NDU88_006361 [Pleurodeles waltl]
MGAASGMEEAVPGSSGVPGAVTLVCLLGCPDWHRRSSGLRRWLSRTSGEERASPAACRGRRVSARPED